jgi:aminoglycoside 6'-N-acetyltransferase I
MSPFPNRRILRDNREDLTAARPALVARTEKAEMIIERCTRETLEDWIRLRQALWPQANAQDHRAEAVELLARESDAVAFLARDDAAIAVAFAEAALRRDYVNGCATTPVGFLEGLYVRPGWRRRGVARRLCHAAEDWAAALGCSEFASDAVIGNDASHGMHKALGFEETERIVFYRKLLPHR